MMIFILCLNSSRDIAFQRLCGMLANKQKSSLENYVAGVTQSMYCKLSWEKFLQKKEDFRIPYSHQISPPLNIRPSGGRKLKGANWAPKLWEGRKLKGAHWAPKIGGSEN